MVRHCLYVSWLILWLTLPTGPARAGARQTIAVLELKRDLELPKGQARTLYEVMLDEFHRSGKFRVLGISDIGSMLEHEQNKRMLGDCGDSCLAELGGAMGVSVLADARLGAMGDSYVFSVKLLDVNNVRVIARISLEVPREEDRLIEAIRKGVQEVTGAVEVSALGEIRESETDWNRVCMWSSLGLGAALGVTGGVFGVLALSNDDEGQALTADILFGVAGAAGVAALVLYLLGDDPDEAPAASAGLLPGGGMLVLGGRF